MILWSELLPCQDFMFFPNFWWQYTCSCRLLSSQWSHRWHYSYL